MNEQGARARILKVLLFTSAALASPWSAAQIDLPSDKPALEELGRQHESAWDLYLALRAQAGGGQPLTWDDMPDWSGLYEWTGQLLSFDPDQPPDVRTTAKLTPAFQERFQRKLEAFGRGIYDDPLTSCGPPGYPRWLVEPYLYEFSVTPRQTWLMNEMVNDIRRVYTDGREHTPVEDRYPLYNGDSIGFWDGHTLVVHTNQLRAGSYQRIQPDWTEQVETVEVWEKIDPQTLQAQVWIYDPPALLEPWYVRQTYRRVDDPEGRVRLRYWNCGENSNNVIDSTEEGVKHFTDFNFLDNEDE